MTVRILSQCSHLKVSYKDATDKEIKDSENIINKTFLAEDTTLKRTYAVRKGLASPVRSFYIKDSEEPKKSKNLLPVGFLPWLLQYYKEAKIDVEHIEMRKWPSIDKVFAKKLIDGKVILSDPDGNEIAPRDYQIKSSIIAAKNRVGLIQLPGGSGKGLILTLLCRLYAKHKIICLFNSISLVTQTYDNFIKYGFDPSEIGIIQGQNFQDDRRITIMSVASYEKAFHMFPEVKVIIADEAHSLGSGTGPEMSTKIIYACQNAPVRIGLSATNDAIDNPFRQMALYGNFGPIVFEQSTQDKIAEGTLSEVDAIMYNVNCPAMSCSGNWADSYKTERITTKKFMKQCVDEGREIFTKDGKQYTREMTARGDESNLYVFNDYRNNLIVKHATENKYVLILYTRREQGEILEQKLIDILGEDKVKRVDGLDDIKTREEAKEFLLEDSRNIILASGIFKQGVDIPWVHCLIIAGAGRGTAMSVQRFVRITRKHDASGKARGKVIDYLDGYSKISNAQSQKRLKAYSEYLGFDVKIREA